VTAPTVQKMEQTYRPMPDSTWMKSYHVVKADATTHFRVDANDAAFIAF